MRLVHCSYAWPRRVYGPARTGSNRHCSHFRRNLSAPVELLLRRGRAGCARQVVIFRRNQDVTAPARIVNMLNICLHRTIAVTKRTRRNRRRCGPADTSSEAIVKKNFERNV